MQGKRFSDAQIIAVLKEAEAGAKALGVCRRDGISEQTGRRAKRSSQPSAAPWGERTVLDASSLAG